MTAVAERVTDCVSELLPEIELARPANTGLVGLMKSAGVEVNYNCPQTLSAFQRQEMTTDEPLTWLGAAVSFSDLGFNVVVIGRSAVLDSENRQAGRWLDVLGGRPCSSYQDRTPHLDDLVGLTRGPKKWHGMLDYPDKGPALLQSAGYETLELYHDDGSRESQRNRLDAQQIGATELRLRQFTTLLAVARPEVAAHSNVIYDRRPRLARS